MIKAADLALSGFAAARQRMDQAAGNIAKSSVTAGDAADMMVAKQEAKANAAVLRTALEMERESARLFDRKV